MIEKEVNFDSNGIKLCGTLALPDGEGRFPAVLFIPGSGQVDRDENHKKMAINAFKELAQHFAGIGIASLRYDKRGVGESEGDFWRAGFLDNISDAENAFSFMKNQPEVDGGKSFIAGHSEGAYISMKLAGSGIETAGVVFLAGGPRSLEDEIVWQAKRVVSEMTGFNKWLINTFKIDVTASQRKQIEKIKKSKKDVMRLQLFVKTNAKWMRESLSYNPQKDLQNIKVPILAITGEKDIQVDAQGLKDMADIVKAPFEYHIIPNVSHILREEVDSKGLADYANQVKKPIDKRITSTILDWLKKRV